MRTFASLVKRSIAFAIATVLASCGTAAVDKTQLTAIHSVFLTAVHDRPVAVLVDMVDWSPLNTSMSLNDVLLRQGLHFGAETQAAVADAFKADGYEVSPTLPADAVVETKITAADYVAGPRLLGGICTPIVFFDVTMKNSHTGAILLNRTYRLQNGGGTGMTGDILLPGDPKYDVAECGTLWSNPQLPINAFRYALPELTRAVTADVSKAM